jgi:hypothetical protein
MHRMLLVRSNRTLSISAEVAILLAFTVAGGAQSQAILVDLTQPQPTPPNRQFRVPGYSVGSAGSRRIGPALRTLPVQLKIVSTAFQSVGLETKVVDLDVEVKNSGPTSFALPISRDVASHEDGKRGRRTGLFHALFATPVTSILDNVVASTYCSIDDSRSYVILAPSESLRVRLRIELPPADKIAPPRMSVGYSEWQIADDRYQISTESPVVKSQEIPIAPDAAKVQ